MTPTYPAPPQTPMAFARRFPDDASCADYLFSLRYPDGYACPKCGSKRAWPVKATPGMMQCENHHKISVIAGTALHRSKMPLTLWFNAAWLVATLKPGISAVQLQRQLGITRFETAWMMLHKLRGGLVAPARDKLSSTCTDPKHNDHWIEVDEVEVGGEQTQEDRSERGTNKAIVMVAVEVHSWIGKADPRDKEGDYPKGKSTKSGQHTRAGRARMRVVPDKAFHSLLPFCRDNIEKGSTILTDGADAYKALPQLGFKHKFIVAARTADPLPTLGRVTTNLKSWLIGTHKRAVQAQHLQAYLNEFVFRFNRRDIPWVAFNRALALAMLERDAVEYDALEAGRWRHPNPSEPPDQYAFFEDR